MHHVAFGGETAQISCFQAAAPVSSPLPPSLSAPHPLCLPQKAIAEGSSLSRLSEAAKVESKEFIYRSYIALGQHNIVVSARFVHRALGRGCFCLDTHCLG